MSTGFMLDGNHDISLLEGKLVTISDEELTAQSLETRLLFNKGESPFNSEYGFPYQEIMGARTIDLKLLENEVKKYILDTENVEKFSLFEFEYTSDGSRKLGIKFSVVTPSGLQVNGTLLPTGSFITVNAWSGS